MSIVDCWPHVVDACLPPRLRLNLGFSYFPLTRALAELCAWRKNLGCPAGPLEGCERQQDAAAGSAKSGRRHGSCLRQRALARAPLSSLPDFQSPPRPPHLGREASRGRNLRRRVAMRDSGEDSEQHDKVNTSSSKECDGFVQQRVVHASPPTNKHSCVYTLKGFNVSLCDITFIVSRATKSRDACLPCWCPVCCTMCDESI